MSAKGNARGFNGGSKLTKEGRHERDMQMWNRRVEGWTQAQIAAEHGMSPAAVALILGQVLKRRADEDADRLRAIACDRYDEMERAARDVLRAHHVVWKDGMVAMRNVGGEWDQVAGEWVGGQWVEARDSGPILAAIDRIMKIEAQRAAMLGYNAPVQAVVTTYEYTVNGVDINALR